MWLKVLLYLKCKIYEKFYKFNKVYLIFFL